MITALAAWGKLQDYTIFAAPCQAEEKDNIGMLIYGTKHVNTDHLTAAIKQHPLWVPAGGFEFGLTMSMFTGGKDDKIKCLMVVAARVDSAKAVHFFTAVYNNPAVHKPLFLSLYFYAIQNEASSRENRRELVRRQKESTTSTPSSEIYMP